MGFTPRSSRQASLWQLARDADNSKLLRRMCRLIGSFLPEECGDSVGGASQCLFRLEDWVGNVTGPSTKPSWILLLFAAYLDTLVFDCPGTVCATPGLLGAVARTALLGAECLHAASALLSILLASSPSTSSCILSWASTGRDEPVGMDTTPSSGRKRRADSISTLEP